jgi:tetratricopeptide (TPR) repeat protein
MELVRGETLRTWVKGRTSREIVEMYRQAGAGLVAAHAAGLVHRDFKPDNAIVGGSDGRVRVVDFGLACETTTPERGPRKVAGTPRYMAPEQVNGVVTPAIDQYSFCVALEEALRESGEPPRWVMALVERGRAKDPEKRFASMNELVRALGRDPARVWRMRAGIGVLVAAGVAAFFVGRAKAASDGPAPCSGGDDEIAQAWPKAARETQLARIDGLGAYGAEVARQVRAHVDDVGGRWVSGRRDACVAHRTGTISDALLDRRMICLDRSRAALGAVGELAATVDAAGLAGLARAVTSVPDPAQCGDLRVLADEIEPPPLLLEPRVAVLRGDLERARIQLAGGKAGVAREAAHRTAEEMRTAGYAPLRAEALLVEGQAAMRTDPMAARAVLGDAINIALASHHDAVAIEAWARRAWLQGTQSDGSEAAATAALGGLDVIEALASRSPSAKFARALLYNNVGSVEIMQRRRAEARASFERALREANGITGAGALELGVIRRNIVLVSDDVVAADRYLAAAQAELAGLLGASHPDTLLTEFMRAGTTVIRLDEARAMLEQTCERLALHDSLAPMVGECLAELADVREELGDRAGAIAAYERAARAPESEALEAAGYLAAWRGDLAGSARELEKAIAEHPVAPDAPLYAQHAAATLQLAYGRTLRASGKLDAARAALEKALAATKAVDASVAVTAQRRVAQIEAELALLAAGTKSPRPDLAAKALAWYRRAGAPASRLSALEAASH